MRKWHRWVSLFAGFFMLWMSVTGVVLQGLPLFMGGGDHKDGKPAVEGKAPSISQLQPDFVCPKDVMCRPKSKNGSIKGFVQHLHSGETFGPIGVVLSTLAGFSLLFFSVSGIWMYVQMWQNRSSRGLKPRWLWK
jgi:uncharacterized iron-regulated membrane protein